MRYLALILCLFPISGAAETFVMTSKVTDVTLYPNSAKITRKAAFSIPAGTHHIVLTDMPLQDGFPTYRASAEGAQIGPVIYRLKYVADTRNPGSAEVQAAQNRVQTIEKQIEAVKNDARKARLAAQAAQTRIGFLDQLGANDAATTLDLDSLRALSHLIGAEALAARQSALTAQIAAQTIEQPLVELQKDLENAQKGLKTLQPHNLNQLYFKAEVTSDSATDGVITIIYWTIGTTSWTPAYDLYLDRSTPDFVTLQRDAFVHQYTGDNWTDVNLTLSTLAPSGQIAPSVLRPWHRRLVDPRPQPNEQDMRSLAEPMIEAPVVIEAANMAGFSVGSAGLGVTYTFANPVSIASDLDIARLPLGMLRLPSTLTAVAIPARDDTAFLIADVTNNTGEDILTSNTVSFYVDGALAGSGELPRITSGDTVKVAFGPINGLRLKTVRLIGGEGEGGIISRYNEQRSHVRYEVQNLMDETWDVQMLARVPYSTHDDLQIDWSVTLPPDEIDVADKIGVLGWNLTVAPGETQTIDLETSITWPSDKELR